MRMPKHSDEDKARFRALVPDAPGVEVKPMFGSVGAFVNGNMFAGLFGTDIGVKLDDDANAELAAIEGSGPFGPEEGPMSGWLSIPASFTEDQARYWMERAREHIATFPPKAKKPKK
jgi:TfoX/Sxy family transcriptional regulator of competence genes